MSEELIRHGSADELVADVAERFVALLSRVQGDGRTPVVSLTGGRIAKRIYAAVPSAPGADAVDWSDVELWWSDERFIAAGNEERNDTQADEAWIGEADLDQARIHPMPADIGQGVAAAAEQYAAEYLDAGSPRFDLSLLGVGPDGHIASLFPGHRALTEQTETVLPIEDSPKPPPLRTTLTLPVLNRSASVWFLVSGEDKAAAVANAYAGATGTGGDPHLPAARVHGEDETLWLIDADAASRLDLNAD